VAEIVEMTSDEEFRHAWPVMRELRPHLDEGTFVSMMIPMRAEGYRLFALKVGGEIVALAGIGVMTNLYDLRHVYVYDLVTDSRHRSKGHGATLLSWLEEFGRREGCVRIALSSGVQRTDAHRFYEDRMGYTRASHVFRKDL
jgi:GNAT superfamily N-acetyltransferase